MTRLLIALILMVGTVASAAAPPEYINYQGVLRDASDAPLTGNYDISFRFYDAETDGTRLLTDQHKQEGTGAVTVDNGLFSVALGSGNMFPGTLDTLAEVFANHSEVWLEVRVGSENLAPRIRVVASAYAINAGSLEGRPAAEFIDTSGTGQTKSGWLSVEAQGNIAQLAANGIGIAGSGNTAGGFFNDDDGSGSAALAWGDIGIQAWGTQAAGLFDGPVGIGTETPTVPLEVVGDAKVGGIIESTAGGFRFPDGTVQSSSTVSLDNSVSRPVTADNVGSHTSIAIGASGKPVISYSGFHDLMVVSEVTIATGGTSDSIAATPEQRGIWARGKRRGQPVSEIVFEQATPQSSGDAASGCLTLRTDDEGNVYASSFRSSATEFASLAPVAQRVERGDVLVIDPDRPGVTSLSRSVADSGVFGVVVGEPGVILGAERPRVARCEVGSVNPEAVKELVGRDAPFEAPTVDEVPVALSGVVLCKVDAGYGAIRAGDLLTTSPTPGHAMIAYEPRPGTILGKALEPLEIGTGLIKVLVMLR